jgi:hypothetical protein
MVENRENGWSGGNIDTQEERKYLDGRKARQEYNSRNENQGELTRRDEVSCGYLVSARYLFRNPLTC